MALWAVVTRRPQYNFASGSTTVPMEHRSRAVHVRRAAQARLIGPPCFRPRSASMARCSSIQAKLGIWWQSKLECCDALPALGKPGSNRRASGHDQPRSASKRPMNGRLAESGLALPDPAQVWTTPGQRWPKFGPTRLKVVTSGETWPQSNRTLAARERCHIRTFLRVERAH